MDAISRIEETMEALERAWRDGDALAFAELHSADASYVAFDGSLAVGRVEIRAAHEPLFAGIMRGSRLVSWDRTTRLVTPDVAVVVQKGGIIMRWQGDRPMPSAKRSSTNTTVLRLSDGRWMVVAFQNTRYRPWSRTLMGRVMLRAAK